MNMTQEQISSILHKIAAGQPISTKHRAALAAASFGKIDQSLADSLGYIGDDLQGAAALALKVDARRLELLDKLADIVGGKLPPMDERDALLSRVRMSCGPIPPALLATLGLAETAPWGVVSEALAKRFSVKPKRAA
jgi:hypothetical protein